MTSGYQNLNVRSTLPVYSVSELVSEAKARPGVLKYSSAGQRNTGASGDEATSNSRWDRARPRSVQGRACQPRRRLVRGDVDVCIAGMVTMAPHIKSGAVRVLATFAPRRLATHPELPTMAELGYPELEFSGWVGVVAPAGTPPEVIERLSRELADIVAKPDMKERLGQWGMEPAGLGPTSSGG